VLGGGVKEVWDVVGLVWVGGLEPDWAASWSHHCWGIGDADTHPGWGTALFATAAPPYILVGDGLFVGLALVGLVVSAALLDSSFILFPGRVLLV